MNKKGATHETNRQMHRVVLCKLAFLRHINDSLVGFYLVCAFTWTINFNSSFVLGKKRCVAFAAMPTLYIEALFMIVVQSWLPVTSDAMSPTFSSSHICTETEIILSVSKVVGRNIGFQ